MDATRNGDEHSQHMHEATNCLTKIDFAKYRGHILWYDVVLSCLVRKAHIGSQGGNGFQNAHHTKAKVEMGLLFSNSTNMFPKCPPLCLQCIQAMNTNMLCMLSNILDVGLKSNLDGEW